MSRLEKLREKMVAEKIPALLLTNPINIGYLSSFVGSVDTALITRKKAILFTDFCYLEEAKKKVINFQIKKRKDSLHKDLIPALNKFKIKRLGFETENLSHSRHAALSRDLKGIRLIATRGLVETLRRVKDQKEIRPIKQAIEITEDALTGVLKKIKIFQNENEVASRLEYELRRGGGEGNAFPPIVAFGRRTSYPHSKPSSRSLKKGGLLVIDCGAIYQGYASDLTRTFVLGQASEKQKRIYSLLHYAQSKAIEKIKPGIECSRIDRIARNIIKKVDYGRFFGHGLGHGIGREVHEGPYLKSGDHTILKPGMVLTVEPGIYISGWGGIRLEDIVLVTRKGCQVLSKRAPEEIPEL